MGHDRNNHSKHHKKASASQSTPYFFGRCCSFAFRLEKRHFPNHPINFARNIPGRCRCAHK
ncbi:putative Appr-1-p processing protein [Pseudomonas phage MR15]|uniref:Putative Appr-1-p processing protein n=1 Tax=Pseudomonas phage MR15 TaxID=2711179 RepID=A0A6M3TE01_9CAUD|nr:putative Appr-1-p processing protein [Pseudomonas phage MR15]QJD55090.1 putative Appr-1-p processing protein [Pseudomonas phage MR13]QJD55242.1 putative Appr-1-p processing protein [Pseudomonas phage MR15]